VVNDSEEGSGIDLMDEMENDYAKNEKLDRYEEHGIDDDA
jgi:hypothetical protein